MSSNFKKSLLRMRQIKTYSFPDSRGFLSRLGMEGGIISTPEHSDDSINMILDEGVAFTGDLPGWAGGSRSDAADHLDMNWLKSFHKKMAVSVPVNVSMGADRLFPSLVRQFLFFSLYHVFVESLASK